MVWFAEHEEGEDTKNWEQRSISDVAEHWCELKMFGGIIYADGEPAAMSMSSALSLRCIDTHFEKAIEKFADDGAYATINKEFAAGKEAADFAYINREEDMGILGLKKAKMSYQPDFRLVKYYGEVF